jgi:hypothetical protein
MKWTPTKLPRSALLVLMVLMVGAVSAFAVVGPLEVALRYVNQLRLVPVVNRADSRNLEGVISSEAVLKKYRE